MVVGGCGRSWYSIVMNLLPMSGPSVLSRGVVCRRLTPFSSRSSLSSSGLPAASVVRAWRMVARSLASSVMRSWRTEVRWTSGLAAASSSLLRSGALGGFLVMVLMSFPSGPGMMLNRFLELLAGDIRSGVRCYPCRRGWSRRRRRGMGRRGVEGDRRGRGQGGRRGGHSYKGAHSYTSQGEVRRAHLLLSSRPAPHTSACRSALSSHRRPVSRPMRAWTGLCQTRASASLVKPTLSGHPASGAATTPRR